jgi:PspAA-like protein
VIVRLMGEGQYRVDDSILESLNELDDEAARAVEQGDEEGLRRLLTAMASSVREHGERLRDDDLSASDAIVPPEDLSLDEAKQLFDGEGLIPDLPTR